MEEFQQDKFQDVMRKVNEVDKEIDAFVDENKNPNTRRKTESDLNIWYKWCQSVKDERKMEDIPEAELDKLLCYFFIKVKKNNGDDYEPDTLTSFQRSFDRHLRENGKTFCIFKDRSFVKSQEVLASKRKQLRKEGRGRKPNKALGLTETQLQKLWDENQLGCHSPMPLLRTVWLNNTMHYGWRARDEHRKVRLGDLKLRRDEQNQEYVIWLIERGTKTRTGAEQAPERYFNPRMYATGGDRCPVKMFK
ncbi:hypothetical protein QZH41_005088 [Actinostola sp. cb2023]|nr:hypothetical protein QZH41_005088 [Actinostola sp. cb2023]